jgi:hypothetical protein
MEQHIAAESGFTSSGMHKSGHKCLRQMGMRASQQQLTAEAPNRSELLPHLLPH